MNNHERNSLEDYLRQSNHLTLKWTGSSEYLPDRDRSDTVLPSHTGLSTSSDHNCSDSRTTPSPSDNNLSLSGRDLFNLEEFVNSDSFIDLPSAAIDRAAVPLSQDHGQSGTNKRFWDTSKISSPRVKGGMPPDQKRERNKIAGREYRARVKDEKRRNKCTIAALTDDNDNLRAENSLLRNLQKAYEDRISQLTSEIEQLKTKYEGDSQLNTSQTAHSEEI